MKSGKHKIQYLLWLMLLAAVLSGCAKKNKLTAFDSQYLDCFDTITSITLYLENREQFQVLDQEIHKEMKRYHQLFDIYQNYEGINNLKTINDNAGIGAVKVDSDIIKLLQFSLKQYQSTEGMVHIAMGSVLSIWHNYRETGMQNAQGAQLPDLGQLTRASCHMDIEKMQINEEASTVYLSDPSMSLDVGAIAKGYAVDRICELLKKKGVTSGLISAGGNVQTIGVRGDGNPWRVGVQNPDPADSRPYLHALKLMDMSLVTSGSYQRYYEVEGVRYHHIIHPDQLMPWNEYVAVTILHPNSSVADALSTAVFNMNQEDGMTFIESMDQTECMWVYPDGQEIFSSGFQDYIED